MFREEAAWARERLARLELPPGAAVLDVGSSTLEARTVIQPYIDAEVLAPLRERGLRITHVDQREDPGVDLRVDLADPAVDVEGAVGGTYPLVICLNMLSFVSSLPRVLNAVTTVTAPGGFLMVSTVENFRWTPDPVDNRWRPSPVELADAVRRHGDASMIVLDAERLWIDDPAEYYEWTGRKSNIRVAGRYVPVPKQVDRLRLRFPRFRWRQSVALLRKPPA